MPAPKPFAICAALAAIVDQGANKPKRWCLNSGARMQTSVAQLGDIELVIDLASATFEHPEISMLREHGRKPSPSADSWDNSYINAIGRWTGTSVDAAGIWGTPIVYTPDPTKPLESDMPCLREGAEVAALMERGHPWQASVKIYGDYEQVAPGQSVEVNGRIETANDDLDAPRLYICRRGIITEASVCLFGADSNTGAVAASRSNSTQATETTMSDRLEALLKRHGNKHAGVIAIALAAKKTDDQIAAELSDAADADHKAALAAKDEEIAKLNETNTANATKIAELQSKLDALKTDEPTTETPPATKGESSNAAPKSIIAGMAILKKEGFKGNGFQMKSAALSRWPALRKEIPAAV